MNQVFVDDALFFGDYFECDESVFHHLFNVHRTRIKEKISILIFQDGRRYN